MSTARKVVVVTLLTWSVSTPYFLTTKRSTLDASARRYEFDIVL